LSRAVSLAGRCIKSILEDILAGGTGPFGASLVLPHSTLGIEMEPLAGALNVCLAAVRNRLDIHAPDGFAVTVTGCARLIEAMQVKKAIVSSHCLILTKYFKFRILVFVMQAASNKRKARRRTE
jgi:hypothetical protein